MVPRKQAGHMTCTRPQAERQILLAMRASSTHDPMDQKPAERLNESLSSRSRYMSPSAGPPYFLPAIRTAARSRISEGSALTEIVALTRPTHKILAWNLGLHWIFAGSLSLQSA